ncbi:MAG: hypothetical protein MUC49_08705 [Raineya sp.]|jgi:hypothetical protein|nr:hypothetical protein [Raineya sp.]
MNKWILFLGFISLSVISCKKNDPSPTVEAKVVFKFKFDSTQERLDGFGNVATIPAGNAGQNPVFNKISAHYFELSPNALTQLGQGSVLYHATETALGGETAIDFEKSILKGENEVYLSIPIKDIKAQSYEYLRISLAYQNYDISFRANGSDFTGTIASFIGYNSYIKNAQVKSGSITINGNKKQGFWAFETVNGITQGQAPGTTVPNPIAATSPIPAGSCVVTAKFDTPLQITGKETKDIIITASLSTNKSFEWRDTTPNGFFEPLLGEQVVDMGIRGMKIKVE